VFADGEKAKAQGPKRSATSLGFLFTPRFSRAMTLLSPGSGGLSRGSSAGGQNPEPAFLLRLVPTSGADLPVV